MKRLFCISLLLSASALPINAKTVKKEQSKNAVTPTKTTMAAEKKVVDKKCKTTKQEHPKKSSKTWGTVEHFQPKRSGNSIQEFKSMVSEGVVIVDFWQEGCPPCKMIAPFIEEFARTHKNERYIKVDVGTYKEFTPVFNIRGVPRVDVYVDGKLKGSLGGGRPKHLLRSGIDRLINA